MFSIFVTVAIFLIAFLFQLLIVRVVRIMHIHPFTSFAIHVIGLITVVQWVMPWRELPYTSILVYLLLTILLVTSSFVPLLGLRSPSSVIMTMLEKEKKVTLAQLLGVLNEKQLILRRLDDLVDVGLVERYGNTYVISQKGLFVSKMITVCTVFMGLTTQG